ncbi:hypothetical protein FMJ29_07080 [Klebsiella michiganensis]|nr:hypothetical protein [Klebsiella michiganensis]
MLRICPGYRLADGGEPVARARRVKRRPREQSAERWNFPEAMLRICSGYCLAGGGEPVARARRDKRRPRGPGAEDLASETGLAGGAAQLQHAGDKDV